jgi:hypothetical protein
MAGRDGHYRCEIERAGTAHHLDRHIGILRRRIAMRSIGADRIRSPVNVGGC